MPLSPEMTDLLVSTLVIVLLGLAIWARVSDQKIIDLLRDIRDFMTETGEETVETTDGYIIE